MKNLVYKTILEHRLIAEGESILIALSGGPDSVALFEILVALRNKMSLKLAAVYVDHGIRKRAAREEELFCRKLCDEAGVIFHSFAEDIPALAKREGIGVEEAGRNVRYALFEKLSEEFKYDKIALGHHKDDRVETILFRIIRGTGPTGLKGMPVKRDIYIRPLFELSKAQILVYLEEKDLDYCRDQSNERSDYIRNFIRLNLLPQIRDKINSNVDQALLNLSELAASDDELIEELVEVAWGRMVRQTPGEKIVLDLSPFPALSLGIRRRLVRRCLSSLSPDGTAPDRLAVERVLDLIEGRKQSLSLPGAIQIFRAFTELYLYCKKNRKISEELIPGKKVSLSWPVYDFSVKFEKIENQREKKSFKRRALSVRLDYDKVLLPLTVRSFQAGDSFAPLGLAQRKKVGDYLTDKKVARPLRDEIPLVTDQRGIIWLVGYEIADRVKLDDTTRKVLKIAVRRRK